MAACISDCHRLLQHLVHGLMACLLSKWEPFHNGPEKMRLCNKRPHNERVIGLAQLPWQQTVQETEVWRLGGAAPQSRLSCQCAVYSCYFLVVIKNFIFKLYMSQRHCKVEK